MDAAARGSTVIDLFVVVAIVVILAAILFPVFAEFSGSHGPEGTCTCTKPDAQSVPCLAAGRHGSGVQITAACAASGAEAESEARRVGLLGCAAVACAAIMIGILIEGGRRS